MTELRYFPDIVTRKTYSGYESICGLKLQSILKGDLMIFDYPYKEQNVDFFHPLDPRVMIAAKESFLQGIAAWEKNISLEMHINSLPNLASHPQGKIDVILFIRSIGNSVKKNHEKLIEKYIALLPLIKVCFPHMEFKPITDQSDTLQCFSPFLAHQALAVVRKNESIALSKAIEQSFISGFGTGSTQTVDSSVYASFVRPWSPPKEDGGKLPEILMRQFEPVKLIFRIRAGCMESVVSEKFTTLIENCESHLSGCHGNQVTLNRQVSAIRDEALCQLNSLNNCCFDVGVFVVGGRFVDNSLGFNVGRVVTEGTKTEDNNLFKGGFETRQVDVASAIEADFFPEKEPFSLSEASGAFYMPAPPFTDNTGLPLKRYRTNLGNVPNASEGSIRLFDNEHLGISQHIYSDVRDRMRHMFIVGQTGTGKSTLMRNMVLQDMCAGKGLAVIDPHGDLVDDIIARMPDNRKEDVILFDFLERERPIGFNLLEWSTLEERDLIIDSIYETLDRIYNMKRTGGPIFEHYMRGMLKLLMGEHKERDYTPTLLEFTQCFLDKKYRDYLKKYTSDPVTLDFVNEIEKAGNDIKIENVSPYITSKFSRFINDRTLKMIVGQEHTGFNFSSVMDDGKLLLVKLGRGRFGGAVSALLANELVNRFKLAAMKRGEIDIDKRREFYMYVDECHTLPPENFTDLLSEARKYSVGLILATQYTAQIGGKENKKDLLDAIIGNVGTIASFRLGQDDAEKIGKAFQPEFSSRDICGLPNFNGYVRMQTTSQALPPFSFKTILDLSSPCRNRASQIKEMSRMKYGVSVDEVERRINYRREIWNNF